MPEIYKHKKLVRISQGVPGFIKSDINLTLPELFPPWPLIKRFKNGEISFEEYTRIYIHDVLDKIDPDRIVEKIGDGGVMLCYCQRYCHRFIVSAWLSAGTGIDCVEVI